MLKGTEFTNGTQAQDFISQKPMDIEYANNVRDMINSKLPYDPKDHSSKQNVA
jgi:hypothetical protein